MEQLCDSRIRPLQKLTLLQDSQLSRRAGKAQVLPFLACPAKASPPVEDAVKEPGQPCQTHISSCWINTFIFSTSLDPSHISSFMIMTSRAYILHAALVRSSEGQSSSLCTKPLCGGNQWRIKTGLQEDTSRFSKERRHQVSTRRKLPGSAVGAGEEDGPRMEEFDWRIPAQGALYMQHLACCFPQELSHPPGMAHFLQPFQHTA